MAFSIEDFRDLYDFSSHYLDRGELRYHYLDEGKGAPIVMLHGNPTWSFLFRDLVRALRQSYRVVVPDHMGCGLSDKPSPDQYGYRLRDRIADLEALLEALKLQRDLTLVVHDWGGVIGMSYAVRHPDSLARLVVLNTAAFHLPAGKRLPWALRFCRKSRIAAYLILRFNAFALAASFAGTARGLSQKVRKGLIGPYDSRQHRIATLRFVQDIPIEPNDVSYSILSEVEQNLRRLREIPMLIAWGEKDPVFDLDFLAEWVRRFPDAEVHRFPEAGHYVVEDSSSRLVPLLKGFLDRHPV